MTAGVPVEPATLPKMMLGPVLVTPASPKTAKGEAVPRLMRLAWAFSVNIESTSKVLDFIYKPFHADYEASRLIEVQPEAVLRLDSAAFSRTGEP